MTGEPEAGPEAAPAPARPAAPPPPPAFAPPSPPAFLLPGVIGLEGPAAAPSPAPGPLPPPTVEALSIPLGPRRLVGTALDLLTRPDAGLRSASFYIGFLMLVTVGPAIALFGIVFATGSADLSERASRTTFEAWPLWLMLALIPAGLGFLMVSVEARGLAAAVIGGRAEGRPLRLRESIAVARASFWRILGALILVGIVTGGVELVLTIALAIVIGRVDAFSYAVSVVVGVVVGTPFVYAPAGIVLGEADVFEALRRSIVLARARKQLAVVVTLFAVLAGLIVQFGLGIAADTVGRVLDGAGLLDAFPPALVVPLVAALTFAYGTLVLLVESIAAAPAVHAFVALTHYTGGLERGRRAPLEIRHPWDPWFTPGLAAVAALGLVALLGGVLSLRW